MFSRARMKKKKKQHNIQTLFVHSFHFPITFNALIQMCFSLRRAITAKLRLQLQMRYVWRKKKGEVIFTPAIWLEREEETGGGTKQGLFCLDEAQVIRCK